MAMTACLLSVIASWWLSYGNNFIVSDTDKTLISDGVSELKPIVRKHDLLVRIAHWTNIPVLSGLILSGLSIYWASPVIMLSTADGKKDIFAIIGGVVLKYFPNTSESERNWFYNHFAFGAGNLATALNIHWLCAYLFMVVALVYVIGLLKSGQYRALLPRKTDFVDGTQMFLYYLRVLPAFIFRFQNKHPEVLTKYNALQRTAYFSVSVFSFLSILTGWAIHKPSQLGWLQAAFGGYDLCRLWHFLFMWFFVMFVIPHVILIAVDGVDTFRSMIVGWSDRLRGSSNG